MERVFNFSAGPAMLPVPVLERAQKEMLAYGSSGMSVMEMSHRSRDFEPIIADAESALRGLMGIPDEYAVLFLQGGATMQFSQVPLNLMNGSGKADYIESGNFASLAAKEAMRFGDVKIVATSKGDAYSHIPDWDETEFRPDADYFHITTNNTIFGTQYNTLPKAGSVPLVCDMSSNILGKRYSVTEFGLIYAGAQKNIGPAGVCVVIVRRDLIGHARSGVPTMLDYAVMEKSGSMHNTPPTYAIYIAGLTFRWVEQMGGVDEMEKRNIEKARILYDYLDESAFFRGCAQKKDRSIMNVTFVAPSKEADADFCREADKNGFVNLKGHRLVGGMRASIYNAMPREGVEKLVAFMKAYETKHR